MEFNVRASIKNIFLRVIHFFSTRPNSQITLLAVIIGGLFGFLVNSVDVDDEFIKLIKWPGELFINSLKLIIIPLITIMMLRVPFELGEVSKAKNIGFKTLLYYSFTTITASFVGLAFFNIIKPGTNGIILCNISNKTNINATNNITDKTILSSLIDITESAITNNLFVAFYKNNILGVIVFSLFFGFTFLKYKSTINADQFKNILDLIYLVLMDILKIIIRLTPVGVFSLISTEIAKINNSCIFFQVGIYIATVAAALLFQILIVYSIIYLIFCRKNPFKFYLHFVQASLTAFATSSSAAALPLTLNGARNANIQTKVANFVLPLGATVNMDGSGVYYPITVLFLSSLEGEKVSLVKSIMIAFISTIFTIGGAPIPSGTLVFLVLVINASGLTVSDKISYIWAIDWLMDRLLTTTNILGDSVGAGIISELVKERNIINNSVVSNGRVVKKDKVISVSRLDKSEGLFKKYGMVKRGRCV